MCRYEGEWRDGKIHGQGTYTDSQHGWFYPGALLENRPTEGVLRGVLTEDVTYASYHSARSRAKGQGVRLGMRLT